MSGAATNMADLQAPYGEFRLLICAVAATAGSVLPAYLVRRLGFQRVFIVTPVSLLIALAAVAIWPGEIMAIGVSTFLVVAGAVESPAVSAYLVRTPAHLRGRVAALVEGSTYSVGYIVGSLAILALHRQLPQGLLGGDLDTGELILMLAAGSSGAALVAMQLGLRKAPVPA
jgi:predicted MFS family arabinose efflux permease